MQEPTTDQAEAAIPTEIVSMSNDPPNMNRAVQVRRAAAKRTRPFDLTAGELLVSQDEDNPARKKPRLEEPLPTTTDEPTREIASPDVVEGLSPPTADIDDADANANPATDTQLNAGGATRALRRWTLEEDAKLTSAVATTPMRKWGKEFKTDWAAIGALVPGRTKKQCLKRWYDALDPSIDRANRIMSIWTADEDRKLKNAVYTHGGKNWGAISALVPGRTLIQCRHRWHNALNPSIDRANGRIGKWVEDEDIELKNAVQTHGGKNWEKIAALVPGRTKIQCRDRWHHCSVSNIDPTTARAGKWTAVEDSKLKDAVQTHDGKNWVAISALVPGRVESQCRNRWHYALNLSIDQASGRTGKWAEDEDNELKDAVQTHGDKNWDAIATLVPGRTHSQCRSRWKNAFVSTNIDPTTARTGKWAEDEDIRLKDAVQTHGGKNWDAIAALVLGRTRIQCWGRWKKLVDPTSSTVRGK
jgi:hypothetical protein